jgi:hypothetical protein
MTTFSSQAKSRAIELAADQLTATYTGSARDERDVAVVRAQHAISNREQGVVYFEFDIVSVVKKKKKRKEKWKKEKKKYSIFIFLFLFFFFIKGTFWSFWNWRRLC